MKKEDTTKKALKAGVGYTIGNIFIRGISFISAFLFARILSVSDYGTFNTFSAYASILFVFSGFALHSSIKNAKIDYKDKVDEYCSSVTLLTILNSIFLLIIAIVFSAQLANLLSLEKPILVSLVVVESFASAVIQFYNSFLSKDYQYKKYLVVSFVYSLLGIVISLLLIYIVFPNERYMGRILGTLLSASIIAVYIIVLLFKNASPKWNKEYWKYGLKISLPIIPHGISQIILSQFDRLMIKKTIGSYEAGIYSFSYNISIIFQVISTSLDTAWQQWFFDQMESKREDLVRKVASTYVFIVALAMVILMLISPELVLVMGGKQYEESRLVTFPILLSVFYAYMYSFPAGIEYYHKKTNAIALGTGIAAAVNVVLNMIFIPRYGYVAAAYTTVVCYLLYYVFHILFSYKIHGSFVFNIKFHLLTMVCITVLSFMCMAIIEKWIIRYAIVTTIIIICLIWVVCNKDLIISIKKNFR